MLAETMVAALRKGHEGCFTCGNKNHLKRDYPTKAKKIKLKINLKNKIENLQKSALATVEECIGPKIVSLNLKLKESLSWKTPSRDPSRSPSTKTWGKFHLLPETLNVWQCCHGYTSFVFR